MERIDKIISEHTYYTRKEIKKFLKLLAGACKIVHNLIWYKKQFTKM